MDVSCSLMGVVLTAGMAVSAAGFEVRTRVLSDPEMGTVTNHILVLPQANVGFMPPPNWTLQVDAVQGWLAITPGGEAMGEELIQMRLYEPPPQKSPMAVQPGTRQEQILARYPGAVVVGSGVCYTEGGNGTYVDVDWKSKNARVYRLRVATVKVAGIPLEVMFQTTPSRAPKSLTTFQGFLTSLRPMNSAP